MRTRLIAGLAFVLSLVGIASAVRAGDTDVRKEFEATYRRQIEAFMKKDIRTYMEPLSLDFSFKPKNMPASNRRQFEDRVRQDMEKPNSKWLMRINKLTVTGNKAIATTSHQFSYTLNSQHGVTHSFAWSVKRRETWVKGARGWEIKHIEDMKYGKFTVDGKQVRMDNGIL